MKKIRKGKDISMVWSILTNGQPVPLEGRKLTVVLRSTYGKEVFLPYEVIETNKLAISFYGKDHQYNGVYSLTLWENYKEIGESAVDKLMAFELVPYTTMEDPDHGDSNLQVESLDLGEDDMVTGIRGLSAYEIALKHGFVGTEAEWLESLGKPAKDAADGLDEKFDEEAKKLLDDYNEKTDTLKTDYDKRVADLLKDYGTKTSALEKDYNDKMSSLQKDYADKTEALDRDYKNTKGNVVADYNTAKSNLAKDYADAKQTLAADYGSTKDQLARDYQELLAQIVADYAQKQKGLEGKVNEAVEDVNNAVDKAKKDVANEVGKIQPALDKMQQDFTTSQTQRANAFTTEQSNRTTQFNSQISAQDATFQSKEATRDAANQAALNAAEKLNDLGLDMGLIYGEMPNSFVGAITASTGLWTTNRAYTHFVLDVSNISTFRIVGNSSVQSRFALLSNHPNPIVNNTPADFVDDTNIVSLRYGEDSGELTTQGAKWLYISGLVNDVDGLPSHIELDGIDILDKGLFGEVRKKASISQLAEKADIQFVLDKIAEINTGELKVHSGWLNSDSTVTRFSTSSYVVVSVKEGQVLDVIPQQNKSCMTALLASYQEPSAEGESLDVISRRTSTFHIVIPQGCNYVLIGLIYNNDDRRPLHAVIDGYDCMYPVMDNLRFPYDVTTISEYKIIKGLNGYLDPQIAVGDLYVDKNGDLRKVIIMSNGDITNSLIIPFVDNTIYLFLDNALIYRNGVGLVPINGYDSRAKLEVSSVCLDGTPTSDMIFPTLCAVKVDNSKTYANGYGEHSHELPIGWLYYNAETSDKLYYSSGVADRPHELCSWDFQLSGGKSVTYYSACVCPNGDLIFVPRAENNADRTKLPIIYKSSDNYSNPVSINVIGVNSFGESIHPCGWFGNSGVQVNTNSGDVVFAEYVRPNFEPANIWKVSAPYDNPENWKIVYATTGRGEGVREVEHFHSVNLDSFTNALYVATGDLANESKILISQDGGDSWNVAYNADGDEQKRSFARSLNFVFTKDACYYGSDNASFLLRVHRGNDGLVDWNTIERVIDRNFSNSLDYDDETASGSTYYTCLIDNPFGILLLQRNESLDGKAINVYFYDIERNEMQVVHTLPCVNADNARAGFRCDAVNMYQSPCEKRIICGYGQERNYNEVAGNNAGHNDVCNLALRVY